MSFTLLDGILVLVTLISAVLAMIRGFTREVFAIGSWVAAAVVTYMFWERVLPFTQNYIEDRNLALGVTILGIFFVTLIVVSVITMRISDFVLDSRAGPLDRTLGFIFGAARGLILVVIAVLFLNFFMQPDQQPPWIAQAKTKPWLDSIGNDLLSRLPEDPEAEIMDRLRSSPDQAPPPAADQGSGPSSDAPGDPGYAPDDQNALEQRIEALPQN